MRNDNQTNETPNKPQQQTGEEFGSVKGRPERLTARGEDVPTVADHRSPEPVAVRVRDRPPAIRIRVMRAVRHRRVGAGPSEANGRYYGRS